MQKIALENNLSETVFFVPCKKNPDDFDFEIRWFTPAVEINLCGHATLASAYVIFNYLHFDKPEINFSSKSGILKVTKNNSLIEMDFPSWMPEKSNINQADFEKALGGMDIVGMYKNRDLLLELKNEVAVKNCAPGFFFDQEIGL